MPVFSPEQSKNERLKIPSNKTLANVRFYRKSGYHDQIPFDLHIIKMPLNVRLEREFHDRDYYPRAKI